MGAAHSNEEFVRSQLAACNRTDSLVLGNVLEVQVPREYGLDLHHLGTVYAIDADHSGKFSKESLIKFANFYCTFRATERSVDSDSKFQAYCTLRLWNDLSRENGVEEFVGWVSRLILANDQAIFDAKHVSPVAQPEALPAVSRANSSDTVSPVSSRRNVSAMGRTQAVFDPDFVSWDSMRDLHKLFCVRHGLGLDLPSFFDLLERAAEEQGAAPAEGRQNDSSVPLKTVLEFAKHFALGFVAFLTDLGFSPNMPLDK